MSEGPLWALIAAVVSGLFVWLTQRLRGQTDETVAVLGQWERLLDAHKQAAAAEIAALKERLTAVEKELAEVRDQASKDMAALRQQHSREIDEMRTKHRAEMKELRENNAGLQRMIAQNSQSMAYRMGRDEASEPLNTAFPPVEDEGGGK